jgi:hypothetical protein
MSVSSRSSPELLTTWVIWITFCGSVGVLHWMVLSGVLPPPADTALTDQLLLPFAGVAFLLILGALFMRNLTAKRARANGTTKAFPLFVIGLALCEAPVILGFVLGFHGSVGNMLNLSLPATAVLLSFCPAFLFARPK